METKWRVFEPWCRELRGLIETTAATRDAMYADNNDITVDRQSKNSSKADDVWELRLMLPRPSHFSPSRYRQRTHNDEHECTPNRAKLQAMREALNLLWLVRCVDEKVWLWLLVHYCGVGGGDAVSWTDDARIVPEVLLQPNLSESIEGVLSTIQQCQFLLVTLQDESLLSEAYHTTKKALLGLTTEGPNGDGGIHCTGYDVTLGGWLSPRTRLTACESDAMWQSASTMLLEARDPFKSRRSADHVQVPPWQLQAVDLYLHRSVLTFDSALALLDLVACGVTVNELWMDLCDSDDDQLTASGSASLLNKLFASASRPRTLKIDCENATMPRLDGLVHLLQTPSLCPSSVSLDRFGMASTASDSLARSRVFELLGRCLSQASMRSLKLDIPDLCLSDVASVVDTFDIASHACGSCLSSLALTVDCHAESWPACLALLKLVGYDLQSLEMAINGTSISDKATAAILHVCPQLQSLKLHRVVVLSPAEPLGVTQFLKQCPQLRSLALPRFHAPRHVLAKFAAKLADPGRVAEVEELHVDLSELSCVDDDLVAAFTSALRRNPYLRTLNLTLDSDAAAALSDPVHDDFFHLHNQVLYQPLRSRYKLAFLSVVANQSMNRPPLSQLPIALVFQFAATRVRRKVNIHEPGTVW